MLRTARPFFISLLCCWGALIAVAFAYASHRPHSDWIWQAAVPAFILETLFYIGSGFEQIRAAFAARVKTRIVRGLLIWTSALAPYLIYSTFSGTFVPNAFAVLAFLAGVLALWHAVLPRRIAFDIGFLIVAAVPFLLRVFPRLYLSRDPHLRMDSLGHLMWIRVGVLALLVLREWNPGPVSFWPRSAEWRIGLSWFLIAAGPLVAVALLVHDVTLVQLGPWWRVCGLGLGWFLAGLWVIAFAEELFFRGVIERALLRAGPLVAVAVSSLLYAAAHLGYRGFPDYRRAATALVLGIACAIAYWRSASIRSSMVTHACALALWKMFFR